MSMRQKTKPGPGTNATVAGANLLEVESEGSGQAAGALSGLRRLADASVKVLTDREGQTSGLGYTVLRSTPGRGFSCTELSEKEMPNKRKVELVTFYPGPFDGAAGYPTDITEQYRVFVGMDRAKADGSPAGYAEPPVPLPEGATRWLTKDWNGPTYWYAVFEADGEKAEAFAAGLPVLPEGPLKEGEGIFIRKPE